MGRQRSAGGRARGAPPVCFGGPRDRSVASSDRRGASGGKWAATGAWYAVVVAVAGSGAAFVLLFASSPLTFALSCVWTPGTSARHRRSGEALYARLLLRVLVPGSATLEARLHR